MRISMHTLKVLIKKDFKLLSTNRNVVIMLILPIGFCALYQFLFTNMLAEIGGMILNLCVLLTMTAVGVSCTGMMVAEEKEKNTLRVLMLNNVSSLEYILSKVIVIGFMTLLDCLIVYGLVSYPLSVLPVFLLAVIITTFSMLMFGALVGISSKDQMSTSTLSTPLMILFLIPPMFDDVNDVLANIASILPTAAMANIIERAYVGDSFFAMDTVINFGIIIAWIIISVISFSLVYKKKSIDN